MFGKFTKEASLLGLAKFVKDASGNVLGLFNPKDGSTISLGGSSVKSPATKNIATRYWMTGTPNIHASLAAFFTGASASLPVGHVNHFIELEGKFKRVRLILANVSTTNVLTYQGFCVGVASDMATDKVKDNVFATGQIVAGVTVPKPTGLNTVGLAFSDWVTIAAIPRTDQATAPAGSFRSDGSLPYILCVRSAQTLHDGTSLLDWTYSNRANPDWINGRGQVWAKTSIASAAMNLQGAFPGGGQAYPDSSIVSSALPCIAGVQYECDDVIMTIMLGGDSTTASGGDGLRGVGMRAALPLSTAATPIETANFGMSTKNSTTYSAGAVYAMPFINPTHYVHALFSPNDTAGGAMTPTAFNAMTATMTANRQLAFAAARAVGAACLMWDGMPRSVSLANSNSYYTLDNDTRRLAYIASEAKTGGMTPIFVNSAMWDGVSSPQKMRYATNGFANTETIDGLHINAFGEVPKAAAFTPVILAHKTAYFS